MVLNYDSNCSCGVVLFAMSSGDDMAEITMIGGLGLVKYLLVIDQSSPTEMPGGHQVSPPEHETNLPGPLVTLQNKMCWEGEMSHLLATHSSINPIYNPSIFDTLLNRSSAATHCIL